MSDLTPSTAAPRDTAPVRLSAAFPTSLATPGHVRIAEDLGYHRAWLYDTPQQSPDVWMVLGLTAAQTSTIGIGPGVLVPSLRHPMVNAAGAAALEQLAPGRVAVAFGTGYTARRALGVAKPIAWATMERYIHAFDELLAGRIVEWEGAKLQMLHDGDSAHLPVRIPIFVGATGPKGLATAERLGADGIFVPGAPPEGARAFGQTASLVWGTVLDDGEPVDADRVRDAAGPGVAQAFHGAYELFGAETVTNMPGGAEWLGVVEDVPEDERHLVVHRDHCLRLNEADRAAWDAGSYAMATSVTLTGTPGQVRDRVAELADAGVTDIVYQPTGDVARELAAFSAALLD